MIFREWNDYCCCCYLYLVLCKQIAEYRGVLLSGHSRNWPILINQVTIIVNLLIKLFIHHIRCIPVSPKWRLVSALNNCFIQSMLEGGGGKEEDANISGLQCTHILLLLLSVYVMQFLFLR